MIIIKKDVLPSTNDFIKEHYASLDNYTIVRANYQTNGKGRLSRTWEALENNNDEVVYKEAISWYDEESIDETGGIKSTYNPKSKWDWYVEGGRWSGSLKLKEGGTTDSAYAEEIDFSPSKEDSEYYGRVWDLVVDGVKPENDDEDFKLINNVFSDLKPKDAILGG